MTSLKFTAFVAPSFHILLRHEVHRALSAEVYGQLPRHDAVEETQRPDGLHLVACAPRVLLPTTDDGSMKATSQSRPEIWDHAMTWNNLLGSCQIDGCKQEDLIIVCLPTCPSWFYALENLEVQNSKALYKSQIPQQQINKIGGGHANGLFLEN